MFTHASEYSSWWRHTVLRLAKNAHHPEQGRHESNAQECTYTPSLAAHECKLPVAVSIIGGAQTIYSHDNLASA